MYCSAIPKSTNCTSSRVNVIFFKEKIHYLGHVITKGGITVDPEKIRTIMEWSVLKDVVDIRSFMGLARYYQRFVEGFSRVAYPITSLQKKRKRLQMDP